MFSLGIISFSTPATTTTSIPLIPISLAQSQQLVVVIPQNWDTAEAKLYRYQRENDYQAWQRAGNPIPVVIGKNGMGWGVQLQQYHLTGPYKHEGDNKAPAGVFPFGTAFGFAATSNKDIRLTYTPLTDTTVCVDDTSSQYYNQIINSAKIPANSWHSGEKMRTVPGYVWGAMIDYNTPKPVPGKGSCIFMHIWKSPTKGTAGCTAMTEIHVKEMLAWLNPTKKPLMVALPQAEYQIFEKAWQLPKLS